MRRWSVRVLAGLGLMLPVLAVAASAPAAVPSLPEPLTATPGDAGRGRTIVTQRQLGLCLLCHSGPFPEERFQGSVAGSLAGVGSRMTAGQLRLRIVDSRRLNPDTVMPSFHRVDGLDRVGQAWRGKPILDAQQVEDVVAFLLTLQ